MMLKTKHCQDLLEQIKEEPRALWRWMLWCTEIPRPSGSTQKIRDALVEVAKQMKLEHATDAAGNVKILKPATPGYEHAEGVVLQAHIDIVAVSNSQRPGFVPETDAVEPFVRDGWMYARGTSLGADDGMGVAMCLALLESNSVPHPRLLCLFTNDEETTMCGAEGLTGDFVGTGYKYLVNVDSEDVGVLCLGCAGGAKVEYKMCVARAPVAAPEVALSFSLSGLFGGHTGVDIHRGRANALKALARIVLHCGGASARLVSLEGGTATNAITSSATAVLVVPEAHVANAEALARASFTAWRTEYSNVEPVDKLVFEVARASGVADALSPADTRRVLHFWTLAPHEALRMSPEIEGFVESSCAMTICKLPAGATEASFLGLARTSRDSQWQPIEQRLQALADLSGAELVVSERFPGWLPKPSSALAKASVAAWERVSGGKAPKVLSVHAGLECGFIMEKAPQLVEAVSIGPQVENPHSCDERCELSSGPASFNWLLEILAALK